jgi:BirA family biotin operon repressor/biotin-[acetyl-CoA-carboxylase] ligase
MIHPKPKTRHRVLDLLADAEFHSGTALGESLGMSRAAVNKAVQQLINDGLTVHCVTGRGYRLAEPLELLDSQDITQQLIDLGHDNVVIHVHERLQSTSQYLLEQESTADSPIVCLAEHQTAGRGRRGRQWLNTPYRNLMLSMRQQLNLRPTELSGLSLAIGVAAAEALMAVGYSDLSLKWPNDLLYQGRKLGGVLLDLQGESDGPTQVIAGLGINMHMDKDDADEIEQAWTDLRQLPGPSTPQRNRLAVEVVSRMLNVFAGFESGGFTGYRERWQQLNAHAGQAVVLTMGENRIEGIVEGINEAGALLLRTSSGLATYHSGEVSLRPQVL